MSLDITTRCTLSHINLRKEGGDDCPSTAVDLKLTGMETGIGLLLLILAGLVVAFADQNQPDAPPAGYHGRAPARRIA